MFFSSFFFLSFSLVHIASFIPVFTPQLSICILTNRFSDKTNITAVVTTSEAAVVPTEGISLTSNNSLIMTQLSDVVNVLGTVHEPQQTTHPYVVVSSGNESDEVLTHFTTTPTPSIGIQVQPTEQPTLPSLDGNNTTTNIMNLEDGILTPSVSSTLEPTSSPGSPTSSPIKPTSTITLSTSVHNESITLINATQAFRTPVPTPRIESVIADSGNIDDKLGLVHMWDQQCGNLSYTESFSCYDKHYGDYYGYNESSLWNTKSQFNFLINTDPTPIREPCISN